MVKGTAMKFGRDTLAKTGKEPTIKLLKHGAMPKTKHKRERK